MSSNGLICRMIFTFKKLPGYVDSVVKCVAVIIMLSPSFGILNFCFRVFFQIAFINKRACVCLKS